MADPLPTIAETYPGFETESWVAMLAPAATPKPVIERLHGTLAKMFADATVRERFEAQGCDIVAGTPEDLERLVPRGVDVLALKPGETAG